jgi:hypothetical protein
MSFTGRKMALIPYDRIDWFGNDALELGSMRVYIERKVTTIARYQGGFRRLARLISSLIIWDRIVTGVIAISLSTYPTLRYNELYCYNTLQCVR